MVTHTSGQDKRGNMNNTVLKIPPQPEEPPGENYLTTKPEVKPRFESRSASEALEPQPPIEFVVDSVVTRGSVNLFFGEAGSKKTYILLYLGACASVGKNFLNFTTTKSRVLIIDEESGNKRLLRRLGEVLRGALILDPSNIEFMTLYRLKLDKESDVIDLQNFIMAKGFEIVIIDALSDVMDGDENSKEYMQPVFNNLRLIADKTNAAIFIIHHPNKTGGYRGSSAIKGSVDLMIEVVSPEDSDLIKFSSKKERDIEKVSFMAKAVWVDDQFYLQALDFEDRVENMSDAQKFVVEILKEHGNLFIKELVGFDSDFTEKTITQAIKDLAKAGIITRINEGGRGKAAQYGLKVGKE